MTSAIALVFAMLIAALPKSQPQQNDVHRLREYVMISMAIAEASDDIDDQSALASIGAFESGYTIRAVGKLGEVGVWQLMAPAPKGLRAQAKEALRRLHAQGWAGYTGERGRCPCPLAVNRRLGAGMLAATFGP